MCEGKERAHNALCSQIDAYLAAGGIVTRCPMGASGIPHDRPSTNVWAKKQTIMSAALDRYRKREEAKECSKSRPTHRERFTL